MNLKEAVPFHNRLRTYEIYDNIIYGKETNDTKKIN